MKLVVVRSELFTRYGSQVLLYTANGIFFTYLDILKLMLIPWAKQGALENGDVAVMKLLNLHSLTEQKYLDVITILKGAKHKNIVWFLGYCSETQAELLEQNGSNVMEKEKEMLLCFEYVPNGNIKHYLQQGM